MVFWNSEKFFYFKNLSSEIERQSAMIGYINAFYFLAVTGFLALPLILFVKTPKKVKKVN